MKEAGRGRRRALAALAAAPVALAALFARGGGSGGGVGAGRPAHHVAGGGFCNSNGRAISKSFSQLLKWRSEVPDVKLLQFPLAKNNPEQLTANTSAPALTWVGHATFLIQMGGVNILTDPHFSERASPFSFAGPRRGTPPGLALDQLPPLDAVLISHNHYDHFDEESLRQLARRFNPLFVAPLKLGAALTALGAARVQELDWGQSAALAGGAATATAAPCHHWSARGMFDRNETLWASYVIEAGGARALFIGDTGYSDDFAALGKKYERGGGRGAFDLALIPIGAYAPRWFMQEAHINPDEAVRILQDLRARRAAASHWGVFPLTNEPMDEPPKKLQAALQTAGLGEDDFWVLQHGETRGFAAAGGGDGDDAVTTAERRT